jgi:hypothetical protein
MPVFAKPPSMAPKETGMLVHKFVETDYCRE